MEINCPNFIEALALETHPMREEDAKLRMRYYIALEYLIEQCEDNTQYTNARLAQYRGFLVGNASVHKMTNKERKGITRSLVNHIFMFWRKKYRYWLLCDIALIFIHETKIQKAASCLKEHLNTRQARRLDALITTIFNDEEIPKEIAFTAELIKQFRINRTFAAKPEIRVLITANVSAGKSTLVNAIVGKPLTRTAQETCTGNLCYLYNKPFEDKFVHLSASPLNLNASYNDLANIDQSAITSISSHFRTIIPTNRICIIDTPGVNSAINRQHRTITRKVLQKESYDKLVCILNANRLGTDEEKAHLIWVHKNVPKEKVVFVLNKLDEFRSVDDSIKESIEGVKRDLNVIGYKNPLICPLSSYFAFLIKLKENGEQMTEDEIDAYDLYVKKFSKEEYDLSIYYSGVHNYNNVGDSELIQMSKKCGIYGLEQILFGGSIL